MSNYKKYDDKYYYKYKKYKIKYIEHIISNINIGA